MGEISDEIIKENTINGPMPYAKRIYRSMFKR